MKREEAIALHAEGKDAWNIRARELLERKADLAANGLWRVSRELDAEWGGWREIGGNAETRAWLAAARAEFSGVRFGDETAPGPLDFRGFIFPGEVDFRQTRFFGGAEFWDAQFHGDAQFSEAEFTGGARFGGVHFGANAQFKGAAFLGRAWFGGAQFCGNAWFESVKFGDETIFSHATFKGLRTSFAKARFGGAVDFRAIDAERAFDLDGARFSALPDFIQAHFSEVPRMDGFELAPSVEGGRFWRSIRSPVEARATAKYRAMRRLAIQAHDYDSERRFLKGEIRSRRGTLDRPWSPGFWLGAAYDLLSDFGGSFGRPFGYWLLSIPFFAGVYYAAVFKACSHSFMEAYAWALYMSLKNSVLLISWDGATERLSQIATALSCLDRQTAARPSLALAFVTLQIIQKIWSAVLLFLALFAIRNRFRIK